MSDFRIRRKPRRDIDIYDYYHPDEDKPKKEEKKVIVLIVEALSKRLLKSGILARNVEETFIDNN